MSLVLRPGEQPSSPEEPRPGCGKKHARPVDNSPDSGAVVREAVRSRTGRAGFLARAARWPQVVDLDRLPPGGLADFVYHPEDDEYLEQQSAYFEVALAS